jgi:hypothetical protein
MYLQQIGGLRLGPWTVPVKGTEIEFNALSCNDPVTHHFEIVRKHQHI